MTVTNPLVSLCVTTRNRAAYLRESLRTILAQDYEPLEILISDNGSEDGTQALCQTAAKADARIRYLRHPQDIGMHANHNFCIEQSRGALFAFFHDDDLYTRGIVSRYVEFLQQHSEVGVVCSDWELIDETGARIGLRRHRIHTVTPGLTYIDRTIRSGRSSLGCSGTMIRRSALGRVRFDEQGTPGFSDFAIWFQIAERWAVGHIPEALWRYRLHANAASHRTIESVAQDYHYTLNRYCDDHLARWPHHAALVSHWRHHISWYLFWALAYELGLHISQTSGVTPNGGTAQTMFERAKYRLSPEAVQRIRVRLHEHQAGAVRSAALLTLEGLLQTNMTWPITWATRHASSLRGLLRLK